MTSNMRSLDVDTTVLLGRTRNPANRRTVLVRLDSAPASTKNEVAAVIPLAETRARQVLGETDLEFMLAPKGEPEKIMHLDYLVDLVPGPLLANISVFVPVDADSPARLAHQLQVSQDMGPALLQHGDITREPEIADDEVEIPTA